MSFEYLCRGGDVEETVMSVLIQLKSFKLESFINQHRHFFQTGRAVVANDIIVRVCLATDQLQTKKCSTTLQMASMLSNSSDED